MTSSTTTNNSVDRDGCRLACDFELLRHTSLFSGLNLEIVKLFAYLANRRTFQPGDRLIEQGRKADQAFILISGSVEISVRHRGKDIVLQQLEQGTFFGELALLAQFTWFFSARASDNVEALIINRAAFQKVMEKYPAHKDKLVERVIQLRVDRLVHQTSSMLDRLLGAKTAPATVMI